MSGKRLVAVSYPADEDYATVNRAVLADDAEVVFLRDLPEADRLGVLTKAEVLIGWNLQRELPDAALLAAPGLRFIQLLSAGADGVDFAAIRPQVRLAGNVGAYAEPMAEHVLAMTLALAKRLPQRHAALARGEWRQSEPLLTLRGAVCGILGFGGIGRATARLMRPFGARIHAITSSGTTSEDVEFCGPLADLDVVLAAADVLVVSLPLTKSTRGLIGARELGLMKPAAIVVNVARGAIIDEQALYSHLVARPDFGAGLDAWWHEPRGGAPFRTGYPFFDLPNVIGSPHNSGIVPGVLLSAAGKAAENALRYLRGEPVTGVMNRDDYL
ncbi:MAG TPA: 2-hydroxyacid dehydrogenase [Streptosporangiaceae bacterium]